ncbi:hypothetical protein GCM10027262_75190 [Nocardia tengchongensis]
MSGLDPGQDQVQVPGEKLPNRLPACVIGVALSWLASRRAPCEEWLERGLPELEVALPALADNPVDQGGHR